MLALANDALCHSNVRTSGWVASTMQDALALGWSDSAGTVTPLGGGAPRAATPCALWRCVGSGGGANNSAACGGNDSACSARGWVAQRALGWAFAPLRVAETVAESRGRS